MSPTISACLIVRNEAQLIARCLRSVAPVCDEIVVVDTGSTDGTGDIARGAGARVIPHRWDGNYGRARNVYLRAARADWIFVIDGDEALARRELPAVTDLTRREGVGAYRLRIRNYTADFNIAWNFHPNDGTYRAEERFSGCPGWTSTRALRLFRNLPGVRYESGKGFAHVTPAASLRRIGARVEETEAVAIHHFECVKRGGGTFIRAKQDARLDGEIARASSPPYEPDAFLNAAKTLFAAGRDADAARVLATAVRRHPDFADAFRLWGMVDLQRRRLPAARAHLRTAVDLDPGSADAWAMLGIACVESRHTEEARGALMRALALQPQHLLACNSLGVLYEDLGRHRDARRHYARALRLHPGFSPARENLSRLQKSR